MTREQYIRMTEATRRAADRLPGRAKALRAPTLLCAAIYCASLLYLMFTGDGRIVRAAEHEVTWEEEIIYTKAGPTKTMAPRAKDTIEEIRLDPDKYFSDYDVFYRLSLIHI